MKIHWTSERSETGVNRPHDGIVLVLQGGGALGAYQAGAFEALSETVFQPDWIVGVSIGAINAALIAGNLPQRRVERLREFWLKVSSGMPLVSDALSITPWLRSLTVANDTRSALNQLSAWHATWLGIPGFYQPRLPPPPFQLAGTPAALSLYDAEPLRKTLEELIDFDLINHGTIRLSLGAVNVKTGNSHYFDTTQCQITPEHIMASGALPPSFAPVSIDGQAWWDGGIVSNAPLQQVLDTRDKKKSLLIFQVDLFNARGALPNDFDEVLKRYKDIQYSSRTRYTSNMVAEQINLRRAVVDLLAKLPKDLLDDPEVQHLQEFAEIAPIDLVHLIYRPSPSERESKDYEFSRLSVLDRWESGRRDLLDTIMHPDWLKHAGHDHGAMQYDLMRHSRMVSSAAE
ncbi:MAG: patatin-like phospholipase family protein [bacterium]|jgi:NTE family protein